jgi:hypothetical protein
MHVIDAFRSGRRLLRVAPCILSLGAGAACSTLRTTLQGYEVGPNGIARPQQRLREALAASDFVRALAWHDEDELLDRLSRATAAYYGGQFLRAGAMLDTAALLSDDRITARLSRDALALVTNDNARPYRPRRTERLFIPYFGMLAYARAGSWSDAAVEARRLLAQIGRHDGDRDDRERPLHATMEHLAGAVLERAGYADEAQVAYRIANRLHGRAPERIAPPEQDSADILVVVERGFVAHRVTERIDVHVGDDESHRWKDDPLREREEAPDADTRPSADPRRPTNASSVLTAPGAPAADSSRPARRHRRRQHDDDAEHWIAIAFPALRRSERRAGSTLQLRVDTSVAEPTVRLSSLVDDAVAADEQRDRLAMLARATARAGAKYALARAAKDAKGEMAGALANYGASLLERADVRSWHLLPQEVQLVRARVPAGARSIRVEVEGDGPRRTIELGTVTLRSGALTIVPVRLWREHRTTAVVAAR